VNAAGRYRIRQEPAVSCHSAAQAADRLGEQRKAKSYFAKLVTVAENADSDCPAIAPAKLFLAKKVKSLWIEALYFIPVETRWERVRNGTGTHDIISCLLAIFVARFYLHRRSAYYVDKIVREQSLQICPYSNR
jgi:hypothetical protein